MRHHNVTVTGMSDFRLVVQAPEDVGGPARCLALRKGTEELPDALGGSGPGEDIRAAMAATRSYMLGVKQAGTSAMSQLLEDLYNSPNGDRWRLIRDPASGRMFVRHEPNLASGGRVSDTDVDEFLSRGGSGPEYAALRKLLGELGENR